MDGETACEYAGGALPEAAMGEARIYNGIIIMRPCEMKPYADIFFFSLAD